MSRLDTTPIDCIIPPDWCVSIMMPREERALLRSLKRFGWLQPLVVMPVRPVDNADGVFMLIDGFHRWRLVTTKRKLYDTIGLEVPICIADDITDRQEALLLHLVLNGVRGSRSARLMANAVRELSQTYVPNSLASALGLQEATIRTLRSATAFAAPPETYRFNRAWYPSEGA